MTATTRFGGWFLASALILAGVDAAHLAWSALGRDAEPLQVAATILALASLMASAGLVAALVVSLAAPAAREWVTLVKHWRHRGRRGVAILAANLAVGLAAGAFVADRSLAGEGISHVLGRARPAAILALGALIVTGAVGGALLLRALFERRQGMSPRRRLAVGAALFLMAVSVDAANRHLYVGLYVSIHRALTALTAVLTGCFVAWFLPRQRLRPSPIAHAAMIGAAAIGLFFAAHHVLDTRRQVLDEALRASIGRRALYLAWFAVDLDRDGFSPVLGGGDCDDFDATVNPDAIDLPDNGIDENCLGGDLHLAAIAAAGKPPSPRQAPSSPPAPERAPAVAADRPDVLLITVDSLRPDRLQSFGARSGPAPTIDALARRGTRFTRAYAASPATATSLPVLASGSFFANLYPGFRPYRGVPETIPPAPTLLNELARRGYHVVAAIPADFHRFFQAEGVVWADAAFDTVVRTASAAGGKPLFLWVHQMDVHKGYTQAFLDEFAKTWQSHLPHLFLDYERSIASADDYIRRLLEWQAARGRRGRTITVLSADHAEEFGEHGGLGHGRTLYEEVVRIPLVVDLPEPTRRVVDVEVSAVDVAPTLRDLLGLPAPAGADGTSLAPYLRGEDAVHPPVFMASYMSAYKLAVVRGGWKLIWTPDNNRTELVNVRSEKRPNLADQERDREAILSSLLDMCVQQRCTRMPAAVAEIDRQLRALGR